MDGRFAADEGSILGAFRAGTSRVALAAAFALVGLAARGSDDATRRAAVADLDMACSDVCERDLKACAAARDHADATCDTNYVGCVKSCGTCKGAFSSCMDGKDADASSCSPPFVACMRAKVAERTKAGHVSFEGGDGSNERTAVRIVGAMDEVESGVAETLWVRRRHPEWRKVGTSRVSDGARRIDAIQYETDRGDRRVFFDLGTTPTTGNAKDGRR